MSRCANCKYDECDAAGVCYDTCPMYTEDYECACCKCVIHDFDEYEDCPYFEEATNEI